MIQWVYERSAAILPRVVVATDDIRIRDAVEAFGGVAVMTSPNHRTGTERCAEALNLYKERNPGEITHIINIQGDEPLINQDHLESLTGSFDNPGTKIATLIQPLHQMEEVQNPNVVKVVVDHKLRACYFSRSPIPYVREPVKGKSESGRL